MTVNGWVFMISVGFNAAASFRLGNELGAGNPRAPAFSVVVVTSLSFAVAVVSAGIVLGLRDGLSYFFTGGEAVARTVSDLCSLLAVTIVLNGVQPVLSTAERWERGAKGERRDPRGRRRRGAGRRGPARGRGAPSASKLEMASDPPI